MNELADYIPLLIPVVLVQLALIIFALSDLRKSSTRGPKWMWILVIVFVNLVGPIVYFILGREEE